GPGRTAPRVQRPPSGPPPEHGAGARDGPVRIGELHPEPRARGLPEPVEPAHVEVLGDDEDLDVARDGARRHVPVPGVGRGHDDAPALRQHLLPARPRSAIQRNSTAEKPSDAYIARASLETRAIPAVRIDASTCPRRMRSTP